MTKGLPMTYDEFVKGVPGDELVKVFENGKLLKSMNFKDIQARSKIRKPELVDAMKLAVDNLDLKLDFLQLMSKDEAIALRLAEAACGSKWKHSHKSHLAEIKEKFPKYAPVFANIGITDAMTSTEIYDHIKSNHNCDKKAKSKIFRALEDDEPAVAIEAIKGKVCITL